MSIRRRKGSDVWFIDFRTPDGGRVRQTAGTTDRKEAQELEAKLKHEAWRVAKLGDKPKRTFGEAALRYLREQAGKADYETKVRHIKYWRGVFGVRALDAITRDEILAALPERASQKGCDKVLTPSTRNRYLATIRAMMNDAAGDWEWIDRAPKLATAKEPDGRIRWITREEARRLLAAIDLDWMRDVTAFGFATGLRQSNIIELEWSQVDLQARRAWIHPDQAKARKPIGVPLNAEAVAVVRRQIGLHEQYVFPCDGVAPWYWDTKRWHAACKRAGVERFRFHDVRHTWASWHVQGGTPLNRLMELGGWASYEMVLRYAHLAPDHLKLHADAVLMGAEEGGPRLVAVK